MKNHICMACLALLTGLSLSGQIAAWDFYGQSLPVTCMATTFNSNLVADNGAGNITRGPGAPASGGMHSFRTTGFQNNGISAANTDYFQVTLAAVPGYKLSLSSLDARFNGTSSYFAAPGVTSQFAYSLDGITFTLIGMAVQSTSLTMTQVNLATIADLQSVYAGTTITLRYYASGQTATGGWGFYSASAGTNGFAIGGTVSEAGMAPPTVISSTATSISTVSAILGGHITNDGGSVITARGTVWATSSPVTINNNLLSEGGVDTGVFVHLREGFPPATRIFYSAFASNAQGTTLAPENYFFTKSTEPSNHVTNFSATTSGTTSIELSWTPVSAGANGYLVLQKQGSTLPAPVPEDAVQYQPGTSIGEATVAANIQNGNSNNCAVSGLSPGTAYAFTIYPFAWDGSNPQTTNYLTGSMVPGATATTMVPSTPTFQWTGAAGNDWNHPDNWAPIRSIPASDDILIFSMGGSTTVINVPSQTIRQLKIESTTAVTLQGSGTLTINGDAGDDLVVSSGCQLNISGSGAITIFLPATATGTALGLLGFTSAGHRLLAAGVSGMIFQNGSSFKAGTGFSGNPFGTSSLNSVVFTSGSAYICQAGGNPFGAAAPASVVVFLPGSLYRIDAYAVPSFGGRTYGNFEMNYTGSITATGSSAVFIDHFTVSKGTFNFNVTGNPGHSIKGNIFVSGLATLIFSPSTPGTVNMNGSVPQEISGTGSVTAGPNSTMVIGNSAGVTLSMDAALNNLTISNGALFTIAATASLTVEGDLVNGAPASGFILDSDASLIHASEGVQGIVGRTIAAAGWTNWQDGWHFISSPVAAQPIGPEGGFTTAGTGNDYDLYAWSESANAWINYKNTMNPPTFSSVNGSNNFEAGKGYLVAYQQTGTKHFTGNFRVSDLSVANLGVSGTGPGCGWHLLGNPFTSSLTWYTYWNPVNIGGVAMIWNEAGMSYSPVYQGEPIPPMNGFMVQVTGTPGNTGSLVMPAAGRIHGNHPWYKSETIPVIRLFAKNLENGSFQESQVRINADATAEFDAEFDGRFLAGYAPKFFSTNRNEHLMVNSLPELNSQTTIPFDFIKNDGNQYQIEAEITGQLPAMVLLQDLKTGTESNLSLDPVYPFSASEEDTPDRFLLKFSHVGQEEQSAGPVRVFSCGSQICLAMSGHAFLDVYSMAGEKLAGETIESAGFYQTCACFSRGYYIVKVISDACVYITKVFIR